MFQTISGKLIKTLRSFVADQSGKVRQSNAPTWDGKDDFGNRLGKGVYLYRLIVKDLITGEVEADDGITAIDSTYLQFSATYKF